MPDKQRLNSALQAWGAPSTAIVLTMISLADENADDAERLRLAAALRDAAYALERRVAINNGEPL